MVAVAIAREAFRLEGSDAEWMSRILAAAAPRFDRGHGLTALLYELDDRTVTIRAQAFREVSERQQRLLPVAVALGGARLRRGFLERAPRLSAATDVFGSAPLRPILRMARRFGIKETVALAIYDGAQAGFTLSSARSGGEGVEPADHRLWGPLMPLMTSAVRLRRALGAQPEAGVQAHAGVEAIYSRDGRCEHRAGAVRGDQALDRLTEKVREAIAGAQDGAGIWHDLVEGRWSLVDRVDSDGRSFVVAYRNPAGVLDPRRLSTRERQVVEYVALGYTNAEVADRLDVTASTVSTTLTSAMRKLDCHSRVALPVFVRQASGAALPLDENLVAFPEAQDPGSAAALSDLSPSEREVIQMVLRGLDNRSIARTRGTSARTVANQVQAAYRKLDVNSRAELAARLSRSECGTPADSDTTLHA